MLLGNEGVRGQFFPVHYWILRWSYLPNFIKINQIVSPPGETEDFADKRTYIGTELVRIRLIC